MTDHDNIGTDGFLSLTMLQTSPPIPKLLAPSSRGGHERYLGKHRENRSIYSQMQERGPLQSPHGMLLHPDSALVSKESTMHERQDRWYDRLGIGCS